MPLRTRWRPGVGCSEDMRTILADAPAEVHPSRGCLWTSAGRSRGSSAAPPHAHAGLPRITGTVSGKTQVRTSRSLQSLPRTIWNDHAQSTLGVTEHMSWHTEIVTAKKSRLALERPAGLSSCSNGQSQPTENWGYIP